MSLLIELSSNKAKARAAAKDLSVSQLENLISGLSGALKKKQESEAIRLAEEAKKAARAEEISRLIAESGLTIEEITLLGSPKSNATKGKTVKPKYRLERDGKVYEWTGRGRTPKVFQDYFDAGNNREAIEI